MNWVSRGPRESRAWDLIALGTCYQKVEVREPRFHDLITTQTFIPDEGDDIKGRTIHM